MTFDVLHRDLSVCDLHFLEASAGTGKTFAIEHYVTRLLLESDEPMTIEQILVVTFTRASTRELNRRIRKTLLRTQAALVQREPVHDYLSHILEQGEVRIKEALEKIEAALVCFESAQIFTLHGFCHRMLTEFAFESQTPFELTSPDEINPTAFYQSAVRTYLLQHLSPLDYSPEQLRSVMKAAHHDPARLVQQIVALLVQESEITSYPSLHQLHQAFLALLVQYPLIEPELLLADFDRLKGCYKLLSSEKWLDQVRALAQVLHSRTITLEQWGKFLGEEEWFLCYMQSSNLKVRYQFPVSLHYPGLFDRLIHEVLPLLSLGTDATKTLMRLGSDCRQYLKQFQDSHFSPDKMLKSLEEALDIPAFLHAIRFRYKAAIVDEFQDTDPIQWNIFKRVFIGHVKAICLVGDPKQSIYAFRRADIYTYLAAAAAVGDSQRKSLDTNYRSTPVLIAALNHLFAAPREGKWFPLPQTKSALAISPVRAGSDLQPDHGARGAVHFFMCSAERGRGTQWPLAETEENQLFPWMTSEILFLRKRRQLPWEEIVILVKDRYQAERLLKYFEQHDVPASFRKGGSLVDSPALMALCELLLAVLHPSDLSQLKCALGGILIGWDDASLRCRLEDPYLQRAKIEMQLLQTTLLKEGFGPFYNQFLSTIWPQASCSVAEELLKKGKLYQELRQLAQVVIEEELAHQLKGDDLVRYLQEIARSSTEEEAKLTIPPQEGKGSVALMTVHLSKGLEFDTVFALALASRHARKEKGVVKGGEALIAFDSQDPRCIEMIEEADAEKMRHLYVALTRAKQQVYIPYVLDTSDKPVKSGEASPIELFLSKISDAPIDSLMDRLGKESSITHSYIDKETLSFERDTLTTHSALIEPEPYDLRIAPEYILSFSSLALKAHEVEPLVVDRDAIALPLGVKTGLMIHRLFEVIFKRSYHHPLDTKAIEHLVEKEVELPSLRPLVITLVIDQLTLSLDSFRLVDVPSSDMYQELEFLFPIQAGLMKGFADLVFCHRDKYYILDWKTNYLADYTAATMEQAMRDHHYHLQASIYAAALKRYVKLFDKRPFEEIFGGAFYVFVRGTAVYHFFPTCYEGS